jgi:hypothetical protein
VENNVLCFTGSFYLPLPDTRLLLYDVNWTASILKKFTFISERMKSFTFRILVIAAFMVNKFGKLSPRGMHTMILRVTGHWFLLLDPQIYKQERWRGGGGGELFILTRGCVLDSYSSGQGQEANKNNVFPAHRKEM